MPRIHKLIFAVPEFRDEPGKQDGSGAFARPSDFVSSTEPEWPE